MRAGPTALREIANDRQPLPAARIRAGSASRSWEGATLRTLPTESGRVMSIAEMRERNAPLRDVIASFFRASYDLSPKTERWYRQNLTDFARFVQDNQRREPRLSDVNKAMVDAFLKQRREAPTRKYPAGSPFAARAAAVSLKRFANYLAEDGILADDAGLSVLKLVKRGKVDDDIRRPLSDEEQRRIIDAA